MSSESRKPDDPRIYVHVLHHVREQVQSGRLSPGQPTATITALCRTFGCTRQTVTKSLRLLTDGGVLTRYPGLGYYVSAVEPGQLDFPQSPRTLERIIR